MQELMSPGVSCLAGLLFAIFVTVVPMWLWAWARQRRDRPLQEQREKLTEAAFEFGASVPAESFSVSTDTRARKASLLLVDSSEENVSQRMREYLKTRGFDVEVDVTHRTSEQLAAEVAELLRRKSNRSRH